MERDCLIRPAVSADLSAIADLERACFSDPWSEQSFAEAVTAPGHVVLVAEDPRTVGGAARIVGYGVSRAMSGIGEILNLAVNAHRRRRGVASDLLDTMLVRLTALGAEEIYLEVRESNTAALALYGSRGFHPVGMRPAYYRSPKEDALVLRRGPGRGA